MDCLERGIWRLSGEYDRVCKVTEIRRSSARDTFIAESVDLALNSLWGWKPVERLKQRSDAVGFTFVSGRGDEQQSSECTEGCGQRKQEDERGENCSGPGRLRVVYS